MNKITSIIVDDELSAKENLLYLLNLHHKEIQVVDTASNVDEAVIKIQKHNPSIVFLDIEMPQKNGFKLIEAFTSVNFNIIFITAYDTYAIKAFEVAALDYLLKPIELNRLKSAIDRAIKTINKTTINNRLSLLKENSESIQKITIKNNNTHVIIDVLDIACIEADRMYSTIHMINNNKYVVTKKLRYYEDLLCQAKNSLEFIVHGSSKPI